ncbi:hypothetical protein TSUD_398040 [Trifolium subterraneum]|uniref:Uncharacterized protein n=1 Tax=Trifolium subterraneum TaxID=3900 RepID=A0A2Z6NVI7_TRISU|nr:hypothetical protein TSUD_398040 [Trifolium subterraneum]
MDLPPFSELEIHSNIGGLKIKILKGHFAALLTITNSGKQLKNYERDGIRTHRKALETIIERPTVYSKDGEKLEKMGLHGKTCVLTDELDVVFRILIHSLIPISGGKDIVSSSHRHLLFFLKSGVKVNFVDHIFSTLCTEISKGINYDDPAKIHIVYPRLLSALFERTDLVEVLKPYYPALCESEVIEVFDAHSLKNMKFISTVIPTPPSESEVVRAQLYYGDLPIISKADDIEVIKKFLEQVYQDTNILILLSPVPDAPEMKIVPKRKRSKSSKKQSKSSAKKPRRSSPHKLPEVTPSEPNTQTQPVADVTDSETESNDNQTLAEGILGKRKAVSSSKASSTSPIAKKPRSAKRLYTQPQSPSPSLSPPRTKPEIPTHSPQTQSSPQNLTIISQPNPQTTPLSSPSPHQVIVTTPPSTPPQNMVQATAPPTPPIIHLSASSLLESLQQDLSHLAYLRDEVVIHPDYFNASMEAMVTRYVRKSATTTTVKFSKNAHIRRIADYPFIQEELSTELLEFIICCQKEQFEEEERRQLFKEDHFKIVQLANLAEDEAIQWHKENTILEAVEADQQQVIDDIPALNI